MKKFHYKTLDLLYLGWRWTSVFFDPIKILKGPPAMIRYLSSWYRYRSLAEAEPSKLIDTYPCIYEDGSAHPFNAQYLYQGVWAARKIKNSGTPYHVDVGSQIDFVASLTAFTRVLLVDIRPLEADIENLFPISGSLLGLPFRDHSVVSLSCLHVAEHIGLGRYGDPLEPLGTRKAIAELSRVLA